MDKEREVDIELNIRCKDKQSLNILQEQISIIDGVRRDNSCTETKGERGGEIIDVAYLIVGGLAVPALLKAVEVFLLTRKIEIEIDIPSENAKIKLSGLSRGELEKKLKLISNLLGKK